MSATLDKKLARLQLAVIIVGVLALVGSIAGAFTNGRQFYSSYLFAYLFWLGLALGCFLITMIHHMTGGRWGFPIRRILEAGFSTLPLMAVLFIPIFFGLADLYPWARNAGSAGAAYMSDWGFILRAIFFFAVWLVIALRLRRWSLDQDDTPDPTPTRKLLVLSGPSLVLVPLTVTFAYVDWVISLEEKWYSTIFGVVILAGEVLAAFAFATVALKWFQRAEEIAAVTKTLHFHQLGNLILTFVLFWTYTSFGQLLVVYSANLPQEITWYIHRIAGTWKWIVAALALFHFFVPFFLLLFRYLKTRPIFLTSLAATIFFVHVLNAYWLVQPSFHPSGIRVSWLDFAAPIGIGGLWIGAFLWQLKRAPLLPLNDPRWREELAHATA